MKREQEGAEKNINYVTIERRKYRKKQNERIPVQNDGKRGRRGEIFSEKREKTAGAVRQFHFVKQCDRYAAKNRDPSESDFARGPALKFFREKFLTK